MRFGWDVASLFSRDWRQSVPQGWGFGINTRLNCIIGTAISVEKVAETEGWQHFECNRDISPIENAKRRQTLGWVNVSLGFTAVFLEITQKYLLGVVCVVALFALA